MKTLLFLLALFSAISVYGAPCSNNTQGGGSPPCSCTSPCTRKSVNVYTGNERRTVTDLEIWGGVGEHQLTLTRYANSRYGNTQLLGNASTWRHSYQWNLSTASGSSGVSQATVAYPDGVKNGFKRVNASGEFHSSPAVTDVLYLNAAEDSFTLQRSDGYRYIFSKVLLAAGTEVWQLSRFRDSQQNEYSLLYNTNNRLIRVTEPGGRYLALSYKTLTTNVFGSFTLATLGAVPPAGWSTLNVTNTYRYSYLSYRSADWGSGNIAEVQFFDGGSTTPLNGKPFGSPGTTPATTYTKATDGNTSTYFEADDATGSMTGLKLDRASPVNLQIKFFPRAGFEKKMQGGRFMASSAGPRTITVLSEVATSDGRKVTYDYTPLQDPSLPDQWQVMSGARYGDGTAASYTYEQLFPGTRPLLIHAVDPRVVGPGTDLKWTYANDNTNVIGYVLKELNGKTDETIFDVDVDYYPIVDVRYANGGSVRYDMNHLTSLNEATTDGLGRSTRYTYDQNGYGFLISQTDALNRTTRYTRDKYGNVLTLTNPDGTTRSWTRDALGLILTATDELGRVTTTTRDALHRATRIQYPDGSFEAFTYNDFSQVTSHRLRNGGIERSTYDSRGLKTNSTDPLGNVTALTYDANDRLASETDARGNITRYQYNERGLVTRITYADGSSVVYAYDAFGNRTTTTNELGKTWTTTYDEFKRVTSITDPLNRTTQYSYDLPNGHSGGSHSEDKPTKITLPSGKITVIAYDREWQKTSETMGAGTPEAATTQVAYDPAGNLRTTIDPNGNKWTYTYDNRDRLLSATDPLQNKTLRTYDAAGNKLTERRPDGGVTTNVYDAMDRVVTTTDPNGQVTQYAYDAAGNVRSLTDARNNIHTFTYDRLNRKVSTVYPGDTHEDYAYDAVGNLASYTNRSGQVKSCTYDNRNRETFCNYSDPLTPDVTKSYDAAGRLLSASTLVASSTYTYDDANQLSREIQGVIRTSNRQWTVAYTYDADGNRASLVYPDGTRVAYDYTGRNQLEDISVNGAAPSATYSYDLRGNVINKSLANGTSAAYSYDAASRLTQIKHAKGATLLAQFAYDLNDLGNRIQKASTGAIPNITENYTYDAVDQVLSATYGTRSETFVWDAVGNRTRVTDSTSGAVNYSSNNLNQYTAVGALHPTYSATGNLAGFDGSTYTYDSANRLISATHSSTTLAFDHDWQNRESVRINGSTTTYFVYDGWNLIAEYDSSGNLSQKYINGGSVDEIVAKTNSTGTLYYHADGLGSTVALTNAAGSIVESYQYDVFGTPSIYDSSGSSLSTTAVRSRFLFTGREWLASLGLYDYRNRVYSPGLGRFIQPDPIGFDAGDINIYRYVSNNPVNSIDSDGLFEPDRYIEGEGRTWVLIEYSIASNPCGRYILARYRFSSNIRHYDHTIPRDVEIGLWFDLDGNLVDPASCLCKSRLRMGPLGM